MERGVRLLLSKTSKLVHVFHVENFEAWGGKIQRKWWQAIGSIIIASPETLFAKYFYFAPYWLLSWWKRTGYRIFNEAARLYYNYDVYVEGWRPVLRLTELVDLSHSAVLNHSSLSV